MKTRVKIYILIFSLIIFSAASVRAATVIGETISTTGLTVIGSSIFDGFSRFSHSLLVTNQIGEEGASLKVDGTYGTTSNNTATIQTVGTTSRLMITSGESLWPTTWSLGLNPGLESEPDQDFQIYQVADGTGLVGETRLTILKSNGRVGIGTTTPEFNLSVDGSILATNSIRVGEGDEFVTTNYEHGLGFWTNGNSRMTLDSIGRLGIGTTTPQFMLDVNGDINVSDGSAYKYNGVSMIIASTTRSNFFFGNSGNLTMSGYNNNALGENAFISNTTGVTNVAFGYEALKINTTGDSNTAVGALSLNKNVSGNNNVAIGEASLFTNNSGDYNVAVGSGALGYNSSGANNTALGRRSGASNEIGSGSVFLGFEAGYHETGSNKLYISNSATVATSSLIYGEFDNNVLSFNANVGIGTTTPLTNLHVFDDTANTQITIEGYNPMMRFTDSLAEIGDKNWSMNAYRDTFKASINPDNWSGGSTTWLEVKRNGEASVSSVSFPSGNFGIGTMTPETNLHVYGGDTATSTVQIGGEGSSSGSCLKLQDRDGAGWTYCTTLDGVLECSITPCN